MQPMEDPQALSAVAVCTVVLEWTERRPIGTDVGSPDERVLGRAI